MPDNCTFVTGTLLDVDNQSPIVNMRVRVGRHVGRRFEVLASGRSDNSGFFSLDLSNVADAAGIVRGYELQVFDRGRQLVIASGDYRWLEGQQPDTIVLEVDKLKFAPPVGDPVTGSVPDYTVRGVIRHKDGTAVSGVTVEAFHKAVGASTSLGTNTTTGSGVYTITYGTGYPSPLQIYLEIRDGSSTLLGTSRVLFNAPVQARLDHMLCDDNVRGSSEYTRVGGLLTGPLTGVTMSSVTAEDIALLVGSTKLSRAQVTAYIAAQRLAPTLSLSAEPIYGLLRQGMPPNPRRLAGMKTTAVEAALEAASARNLISKGVGDNAATHATTLAADGEALSAATPAPPRSLANLLDNTVSGIDANKRDEFLTLWRSHDGPMSDFWAALPNATGWGTTLADLAETSVQLGILTAGHVPTVQAIQTDYSGSTVEELAELSASDWLTLITGNSITPPDTIAGAGATQESNYAAVLASQFERAFPSRAYVGRIKADDSGSVNDLTKFVENNTGFDFGRTNVNAFWSSADLTGVSDGAALKLEVKKQQRLYRVAPTDLRADAIVALDAAGYDSARSIVRAGRKGFVDAMASTFDAYASGQGEEIARTIYKKARASAAIAQALFAQHHPMLQGPSIDAVQTLSDPSSVTSVPDYSSIFGSVSYCECAHCRSVLSPAAYLVDMLHWLEDQGAFAELDRRRPDLAEVELSCENTNTPLPYVDLVNEILETAVGVTANSSSTTVPTSTSATALELAAHPEHLNSDAYTELAAAIWPPRLPFHLSEAQVREYLSMMGIDRAELMSRLQNSTSPSDGEIHAARLRLAPVSYSTITNPGNVSARLLWGYTDATDADASGEADTSDPSPQGLGTIDWIYALRYVPEFLDRAELTYNELLELVNCDYVNSGGEFDLVASDGEGCDLTVMYLGDDELDINATPAAASNPDADDFTRAHVFLRLWRALGWDMLTLDKVLAGLGADSSSVVDTDTVEQISIIKQLSGWTGMSPVEVVALWSGIDRKQDRPGATEPVRSLYERLLLDRSVVEDIEGSVFAVGTLIGTYSDANDAEIAVTDSVPRATNHFDDLRAAFSCTAADLTDALSYVMLKYTSYANSNLLCLEVVNELYRVVRLARGLELSVAELLAFMELTGLDPFISTGGGSHTTVDAAAADALALAEHLRDLQALGLDVPTLRYLLRHDEAAVASMGPSETFIRELLGRIRDELIAEQETEGAGEPTDANESLLRELLTQAIEVNSGSVSTSDVDAVIAIVDESTTDSEATQTATLTAHLDNILSVNDATTALITSGGSTQGFGARVTFLVDLLRTWLFELRARELASSRVAEALGLEQATLDALRAVSFTVLSNADCVDAFLDSTFLDTSSMDEADPWADIAEGTEAWKTLQVLHKAATWTRRLGLTAEELGWSRTAGNISSYSLYDLAGLPITSTTTGGFTAVMSTARLFGLREAIPGSTPTLIEALDVLDSSGASDFRDALAARADWDSESLGELCIHFGFSTDASLQSADNLTTLVDAHELLQAAKVSVDDLVSWREANPTSAVADSVRSAARGQYTDLDTWSAAAKPVRAKLREQQRAALVAWLIANDSEVEDEADLYGKYLIDVEMSPCMMTSRVKQATLSTQLFVQRCLLGLETDDTGSGGGAAIQLDEEAAEAWEWMKNYRVWEAARKVFLYPENWIEPELRDDKTPFFEELEATLLSEEVTDERVEQAVLDYLDQLLVVARPEICAVYHQQESDSEGDTDILHVFARSRGEPRTTWYRRREGGRTWTPWEAVELDIKSNHVLPVVYARRLLLFWPEFAEMQQQEGDDGKSAPESYWSVTLRWSEYRDGRWSPTRTALQTLDTSAIATGDGNSASSTFSLRAQEVLGQLRVQLYMGQGGLNVAEDARRLIGTFVLDPCTWQLSASMQYSSYELLYPSGATSHFQGFAISADQSSLAVPVGELQGGSYVRGTADQVSTLFNVPSAMQLMPALDVDQFASQRAFFLQDDDRTFLVEPSGLAEAELLTAQMESGAADPGQFGANVTSGHFAAESPSSSAVPAPSFELDRIYEDEDEDLSAEDHHEIAHLYLENIDAAFDDPLVVPVYSVRFAFEAHYHPYVCDMLAQVRRHGVRGLYRPDPDGNASDLERQQMASATDLFETTYVPSETYVQEPHPVEEFEFDHGSAYGTYNWELFFHMPFYVADRLSDAGRFEDAMRWYHFIFDPTSRDTTYTDARRYWRVKPFLEDADAPITDWAAFTGSGPTSAAQQAALERFVEQVMEWREDPFSPHLVARLRRGSYQRAIVIKYVENLIRWGDTLFRQDTLESLGEATQLYMRAAEILGDRPVNMGAREAPTPSSYNDLSNSLDEFSNALVAIENVAFETTSTTDGGSVVSVPDIGSSPYFCVPWNSELLGLWDTVEDRLHKLRHCMDIEGRVRSLALFEPPLDPGALVSAAASGASLGTALSGVNVRLPHYRFAVMVNKARALADTVRSLGQTLLQTLEKKDAEGLALLRSTQELGLLAAMREVRLAQVDDARQSLAALDASKALTETRQAYYTGLIDTGLLESEERQELAETIADAFMFAAQSTTALASVLSLIPQVETGAPHGVSASFGGQQLAAVAHAASSVKQSRATVASHIGRRLGRKAMHQRREQEWQLQLDLATQELDQLAAQREAATARLSAAEKELAAHDLRVKNTQAADDYMRSKFTNEQLYAWMIGQLATLHHAAYQLAYGVAREAEACYRYELALPSASFVQYGHWDGLRRGLLSGERLAHELDRMDVAYLRNDRREFEITKQISLDMLDPVALESLRQTGSCFFHVPEALFDLDFPGHYLRRIKSVQVTVPCVTGPYTGVNASLTLMGSTTRMSTELSSSTYARSAPYASDTRFSDELGAVESIAISSGQSDPGLFAFSFQDPRYLPFEGRGAESSWRLRFAGADANPAYAQFDWDSISDVVLTLRYTARDGGEALRAVVQGETGTAGELASTLNALRTGAMEDADDWYSTLTTASAAGMARGISVARDFPDAWHAFLNPADSDSNQVLTLALAESLFPTAHVERGLAITGIQAYLVLSDDATYTGGSDLTLGTTLGATAPDSGSGAFTVSSSAHFGIPATELGYATNTGEATDTLEFTATGYDSASMLGLLHSGIRTSVDDNGTTRYRIDASKVEDLVVILFYTVS